MANEKEKALCAISLNVGRALLSSALFMFLSLIVSVVNGMDSAFTPLAISFIITFIVGVFPFIFVRLKNNYRISREEGLVIIVLSWILSFVFGMLPYLLYGGEFTIVNAWYESVSGYTTTGSTILTDLEALPASLLFWRSSTHFIGGLGIIIFVLMIIPDSSTFHKTLSNIEISSLARIGYRYRSAKIVNVIVVVYSGLVVLETLLLMLAGMSFFDAVNHSFSTIATGGFSTRNLSVAYYDSVAIEVIISVFMLLSSIHFGVLFSVIVTRSFKPFKNPVVIFFLSTVLVLSVIAILSLKVSGTYATWGESVRYGFFQVCSFITTTGFGSADNIAWPALTSVVLIYAAFQCGCSGSTVGGIKTDRIYMAFLSVSRQLRKFVHPTSVVNVKVDKHAIKDEELLPIVLYMLLYLFVALVSVMLLTSISVPAKEAVSGVISSMANCGPGLGSIGTMGTYADMSTAAKMIFTADMILGRMEIYPVMYMCYLLFRHNGNHK